MAALDIRTLAAKLDVGPVSAIHLIAGFIDGVESNRETPTYYGPMFCKLVNSLTSGLPDHADEDLQARPPNPGSEAKPAEHGAPPVDSPEPGELIEALVASANDADAKARDNWAVVEAIRAALQPYVKLAIACRREQDSAICGIMFNHSMDEYTSATARDLRALMLAAGLWTDEMQAPAPNPGPAEAPEAAAPPPADGDDDAANGDLTRLRDAAEDEIDF